MEEDKKAAMEALRRAIARLLELGYSELPADRRTAFARMLDAGHLEAVAVMTPKQLDVRLNLVAGGQRRELLTAQADFRPGDHTVN